MLIQREENSQGAEHFAHYDPERSWFTSTGRQHVKIDLKWKKFKKLLSVTVLKRCWIMDVADRFKWELEISQLESDLNVLRPVGGTRKDGLELQLFHKGLVKELNH